MLSKLIILAGLVCFTAAALQPILGMQKQLRVFQKAKDAVQVQSSLSSTDCEINSRKANPLNRQTYFQCTVNGLALMKCPEKMVFETASSACIRDNSPPERETPPSCPITGGYFPSSTSCEGFWQCSNGIPKYFVCSSGLHYNPDPKVETCDWPSNVRSCGAAWWSGAKKSNSIENHEADKEMKNKRKW